MSITSPSPEGPDPAAAAPGFRYDYVVDVNGDYAAAKVLGLVGSDKRVLELGCATGYMSRVFREQGCQVVAVEIDARAAARASAHCERVIVGDIERIDLDAELGDDRFDVVVAADVLEHLKDPVPTLLTVKRHLRPAGYIVASVPNVAHGSVRLALLGGEFPYSERGLLDGTHLRFFTSASLEKLFADAGLAITHCERQQRAIAASEVPYDAAAIPPDLLEALSEDREALTYQFVLVARPTLSEKEHSPATQPAAEPQAEKASALRKLAEARREEQAEMRRLAEELRREGEAAQHQAGELRQAFQEQTNQLRNVAAKIERVASRQDGVEALLTKMGEERDRLLSQQEGLQATLYDLQTAVAVMEDAAPMRRARAGGSGPASDDRTAYHHVLRRVRESVRRLIPLGAIVLVVSKGDERLLDLYGRTAWHFPRGNDGGYPGYHPANGTAAVAHLEALRALGGDFLLIPATALWWLDHYAEFKQHLDRRYRPAVRDEDTCMIYALREPAAAGERDWQSEFEEVLAEFERRFDHDPAILDRHTGLDLAAAFPQRTVFSPPSAGSLLPYLDHSVDVVVCPQDEPPGEARRVAAAAVVTVHGRGAAPDQTAHGAPGAGSATHLTIEWTHGGAGGRLPSASIIIPCYNEVRYTEACLDALLASLPPAFNGEIIIVDDASTDETAQVLRRSAKSNGHLRLLRNRQNSGFVRSCNRAAKVAIGEVLVFLNNDTLPLTGWLTPLLRQFRDVTDAGVVGGKLLYPDGRLQEAGVTVFSDGSISHPGRGSYEIEAPAYSYVREVDYCSGALLATRRSLFEQVGSFDTRYCPAYYEDVDYCFAVREQGYRVLYQPESVIVHFEGVTSGTDLAQGVKRYQAVNRAAFVEKWRQALKRQRPGSGRLDSKTWQDLADRSEGEAPPTR